jgi:hypothetical protein
MRGDENPHLLKCHLCGEPIVVFARGDEPPEIGCLSCLAANDANKVAEDGTGLISGLLTAAAAPIEEAPRRQCDAPGASK